MSSIPDVTLFASLGLTRQEGEDCYDKVLNLCENVLEIQVRRDELDRAHRVGRGW